MSKTYAEMLVQAKALHPDARIHLNEFTNRWDIIIHTDEEEPFGVTESWAGTPAEKAYQTTDGSYGDELTRWAHKNGMSGQPMEFVAERYNILIGETSRIWEIVNEKLSEAGLPNSTEILEGKDLDGLNHCRAFYAEAKEQAAAEYASRKTELSEMMDIS